MPRDLNPMRPEAWPYASWDTKAQAKYAVTTVAEQESPLVNRGLGNANRVTLVGRPISPLMTGLGSDDEIVSARWVTASRPGQPPRSRRDDLRDRPVGPKRRPLALGRER